MPILDNFTDVDGTLLSGHTPDAGGSWVNWAVAGGTAPSPGSAVIVGNELDNNGVTNSTANAAFYHSIAPASANYTVSAPIKVYAKQRHTGLFARLQSGAHNTYWLYLDAAAETVSLYRVDSGTNVLLGSAALPLTIGSTYICALTVNGTGASVSLDVSVDGVSKIAVSDTSGNRITSVGYAGVWLGGGTESRLQSISVDEIGASSLTVAPPANLRIYQRSGGSAAVGLSGTYSGTPTTIQARVVPDGGGTAVVDWTTVDAAPAAGTWAGSINVPQGGWYNVEVRFSSNTSITASSSNKFGVGALFSIAGQSNAYRWFITGTGTAAARTSKYNGGWATNTGAAAIAFANAMESALGVPVGMVDTGYDAAALTVEGDRGFGYWLNLSGSPYTQWLARVTNVGAKLEGICWCQGEADAFQSVPGATYAAGLTTMFGRFRSHTSQSDLPVFLATLPRTSHVDADDAGWNTINDVILGRDTGFERVACDTWDLGLSDTVHYDATGYQKVGERFALAVRKYGGDAVESRGPQVSAVSYAANTVRVDIAHRGGTDFTPATGITGLRFVDNGTPITPTSVVRTSATRITATFAGAIVGPLAVAVAWGMSPSITGAPVDGAGLPLSKTASSGVAGTDANRYASVTLTTNGSTPAASLTGLKWAWFDQATPDAFVAPTDKGTAETTDASGVLVVPLANTAKAAGETGWLIVTDSDGTTTQSPAHKAFSGPVQVV